MNIEDNTDDFEPMIAEIKLHNKVIDLQQNQEK